MTGDRREQLSEALRWALELTTDPATAAADWLARDIDPKRATAVELLTDSSVPLETLKKAKDAFKTMRVVGEHGADRRLGGRLYLAAIAAAIVHHSERISSQSDAALLKALREFIKDESMPERLREMTELAYLSVQASAKKRGQADGAS